MIQGTEEIWVVGAGIVSIISAAIILIGITFALKSSSMSEKSVNRTKQAEALLSEEHEVLAAEQQMLLDRTADIEMIASRIHDALTQEIARFTAENQELRQKILLLEQTIAKMQAQQERRPGPRLDTGWEMEL